MVKPYGSEMGRGCNAGAKLVFHVLSRSTHRCARQNRNKELVYLMDKKSLSTCCLLSRQDKTQLKIRNKLRK